MAVLYILIWVEFSTFYMIYFIKNYLYVRNIYYHTHLFCSLFIPENASVMPAVRDRAAEKHENSDPFTRLGIEQPTRLAREEGWFWGSG